MVRIVALAGALLAGTAASATSFHLVYTTFGDGVHSPITVDAMISADADPFVAGAWDITAISGTRGAQAITGADDFFNVFYYPAARPSASYSFDSYVDNFGFEFYVGSVGYTVSRSAQDTTFYHEFDQSTGLLILPSSFSITAVTTQVPEPASWALMVAGFGIAGAALRRRPRVAFAA